MNDLKQSWVKVPHPFQKNLRTIIKLKNPAQVVLMGSPFIGTICNSLLRNSLGVRVRNGGPVIPVGMASKKPKPSRYAASSFFVPMSLTKASF